MCALGQYASKTTFIASSTRERLAKCCARVCHAEPRRLGDSVHKERGKPTVGNLFYLFILAVYGWINVYSEYNTSVTQSKASDFYTTEKVAILGQPFPCFQEINKSSCYLLESTSWMYGKSCPHRATFSLESTRLGRKRSEF
jgi:hypothetical protein